MLLYNGELYNDDRLFILDYGIAGEEGEQGWYVVTRRNTQPFPPFRVDRFTCESEVIEFIKKVEPETPRISLGGKSPLPIPSYDEHLKWLKENTARPRAARRERTEEGALQSEAGISDDRDCVSFQGGYCNAPSNCPTADREDCRGHSDLD